MCAKIGIQTLVKMVQPVTGLAVATYANAAQSGKAATVHNPFPPVDQHHV